MAKTLSQMIPLHSIAPDFSLLDTVSGKELNLSDVQIEKGLLVIFMCNHCPYVVHIIEHLASTIRTYQALGITCLAISSNDVSQYPEDSPAKMQEFAEAHHLDCSYLYDESQSVAKAYQAACTPDFYLFDAKKACVYRGRYDESTPGNNHPVTGHDLISAMDALLANQPITADQFPSMGCNIKWK